MPPPRGRRRGGGRVTAASVSTRDAHVGLDPYYASVYGSRWPTLCAALLAPPRKAALWNRYCQLPFGDVTRGLVRVRDAATLQVFVKAATAASSDTTTTANSDTTTTSTSRDVHDDDVDDDGGDIAAPPCDAFQVRAYYLLDYASALVVEQLAVGPFARVLDVCAAPGGKSVAVCQCLSPHGSLVANDVHSARAARLQRSLRAHVPPSHVPWTVTQRDAQTWHEPCAYTRVLVDAPCSSERHVLRQQRAQTRYATTHGSSNDSSDSARAVAAAVPLHVWSRASSAQMASLQRTLLLRALETCAVGGRVVYSTCSLSPLENDGVVDAVLRSTRCGVAVVRPRRARDKDKDTHEVTQSKNDNDKDTHNDDDDCGASVVPSYVEATQHGSLVLPDRADGWGPMYFCVLHKHAATRNDDDSSESSESESESDDTE